jgi:hypothetical protein
MHRIFEKNTRFIFFENVRHPGEIQKTILIYTIKTQQIECLQQQTKTNYNVGPAQKSSRAWGVTTATPSVTARSPRAQRQAHQRKNARGEKAEPGTRHSVFLDLILFFLSFFL